jgi:hypothetical protein
MAKIAYYGLEFMYKEFGVSWGVVLRRCGSVNGTKKKRRAATSAWLGDALVDVVLWAAVR